MNKILYYTIVQLISNYYTVNFTKFLIFTFTLYEY